MGPCMCGDLYCSVCGPLQGNFKCPHCGKWTDEGGCENPAQCEEQERLYCEAEARQYYLDCWYHQVAIKQGVHIWDIDISAEEWTRIHNLPTEELRKLVGK